MQIAVCLFNHLLVQLRTISFYQQGNNKIAVDILKTTTKMRCGVPYL